MLCIMVAAWRVETDVVHAKAYTNLQGRVKGCTTPILADSIMIS